MSDTRQHYNLAVENKATQKCNKEVGPRVPKTDFGGAGAAKSSSPMGKGKGTHRGRFTSA
jgi:hypothetical protein